MWESVAYEKHECSHASALQVDESACVKGVLSGAIVVIRERWLFAGYRACQLTSFFCGIQNVGVLRALDNLIAGGGFQGDLEGHHLELGSGADLQIKRGRCQPQSSTTRGALAEFAIQTIDRGSEQES
jgi:hypothetical protein